MYLKKTDGIGQIEFISRPSNFSAKTYEMLQSYAEDVDGRKIVKAGTILPANDETAKGILVNDIDVTNGNAPGALMDAGYVYEKRLPVVPSAEAKAALKHVIFE